MLSSSEANSARLNAHQANPLQNSASPHRRAFAVGISSTDPGHADRTQSQNYSEENEASVASALLNFDLVVLLSLGDLTLVSHEFNFDVRLDIYCTQPGARLLLNKMTLTGAVPAGRRLAVAEGGREGAQLLHR